MLCFSCNKFCAGGIVEYSGICRGKKQVARPGLMEVPLLFFLLFLGRGQDISQGWAREALACQLKVFDM